MCISHSFCRRLVWSVYLKREVVRLLNPICNLFLMMYHFTMQDLIFYNSHPLPEKIAVARSVRHSRQKICCKVVCGKDCLLPWYAWGVTLRSWVNFMSNLIEEVCQVLGVRKINMLEMPTSSSPQWLNHWISSSNILTSASSHFIYGELLSLWYLDLLHNIPPSVECHMTALLSHWR